MSNRNFNKQVTQSRKPYKHGSYVSAEPNPHVDILKYKTKDGKDDGKRYRVEDSEMKVSKKKMGRPSMPTPAKKKMGRPSMPTPAKKKPESPERIKRQADYMKKHGKKPSSRKTLSVTNSYKKEVEGLK